MSTFLGDFHFIRSGWLLLLPVAAVIWWLWQRRSDPLRGWREQIDPGLLEALVVGRESGSRWPAQILLAGWLLAIVAVAGPTWRLEPSPFADDATPLMIVLKADVSMATPDPAPSRLERAHLKIADLAQARKGQPLGLIAYAGSAHLVLPPTRDTEVVAQMAAEISPEIMPVPGDRLDLALREAGRILAEGKQGGSIVVLADSADTESTALQAVKPELAAPVQFLAISVPGSSQYESVQAAARALGAKLEPLSINSDEDVAAMIRHAANTPVARQGDGSDRWQEAGYWLVPLIGLVVLASFRRATQGEVAA